MTPARYGPCRNCDRPDHRCNEAQRYLGVHCCDRCVHPPVTSLGRWPQACPRCGSTHYKRAKWADGVRVVGCSDCSEAGT